ncbi:hypothetical protein Z946_3225 [Sulfitobacter noctilucicola]|uniref:Cystathionine beta-lyase family protein involved in aluminum resistance n=1 Tax=Sulfitobacter noctilucicola TaxID=1342301 RepID=A0A7W6Q4B6_9RHOB|nr:hypothetical protein [Sulfitobacter noctilucicola]KIN64334.1 hypothetical protein Z946_3225 [Sulfitobacter noctilucicola]MBB4174503.1 cystathionine beta-lyase family protein involved in aluminum resistance [Sulfitobacter noctilucicola]
MFAKAHQLDVTASDLKVIEAALHTQTKILDVQAAAGGAAARSQLNEVKRVLAHVSQQKPVKSLASNCNSWFNLRCLFSGKARV